MAYPWNPPAIPQTKWEIMSGLPMESTGDPPNVTSMFQMNVESAHADIARINIYLHTAHRHAPAIGNIPAHTRRVLRRADYSPSMVAGA